MAEENRSSSSSSMANKVDDESDQPCELSYHVIKQITNNYDEELLLGTGAFGTVYKGTYQDGKEIAVKVLVNMTGINNKEFHKEFNNLRRLKHPNVVQLVAFCNEAEQVLAEHNGNRVVADKMHTALCFEYVHNGNLDSHIPDVGCSELNWHMLYKIIKGICQGLDYLHYGSEPILHLDLKPANVLLTNDMTPKIADFGLSRLLGEENTRKTISVVGTLGYWAPEYLERGLVSKEFDIFSLGIIIAKLMAGRKDYSNIDTMKEKGFIKHVHDNWRRKLRETLAPRQLEVYCEQVKICVQIAVKCMSRDKSKRPDIRSIIHNLMETEKFIGKLGLQTEQPILPEGGVNTTTPEMAYSANTSLNELQLKLLKKITNDFSNEQILGHSPFGKLYKGVLDDGEVIAVKRCEQSFSVHRKRFIHELETIAALKHENLVRLVGFCVEDIRISVQIDKRYIVADTVESLVCYEYLPKGSLQNNLYGGLGFGLDLATKRSWTWILLVAMAAVTSEDLTHLLLPPPKREKKCLSYLDAPTIHPATTGWSLLPDDLVRRIGDSFLATNDVDCYMCFRAVCLSWRASTDDPRNNASDPRFHPRQWVILDEAQGKLLLLNTFTGRFLHKKLSPPLLCKCYVVLTTPSSFVVLADKSPPHAACLFNPLTGVLTRFAAPVPPEASVADVGCNKDRSLLAMLILGDSSRRSYMAVADSESFNVTDPGEGAYNFLRNAVVGGGALDEISGPAFVSIIDYLQSLDADPAKAFSCDYPGRADDIHCFLVGLATHMVLVVNAYGSLLLFKVDTEVATLQPVQSISAFAVFIGHRRCLSVDATKFPGIEANCVYYTQHLGSSAHICKYSLKDKTVERISEAAEFVKQDNQFALVADRPFTTIQLLCSYTINVPVSQLALQQMA